MKPKKIVTEIICFLFIVLFIYAAFSKLSDIGKFRVQLGLSPLLTTIADYVVWGIPGIEVLISIMLVIPRLRLPGLISAFGLMTLFTAYIIAILEFSEFVPCSCGGILDQLGWTEHIVFNSVFILLALVGVLVESSQSTSDVESIPV